MNDESRAEPGSGFRVTSTSRNSATVSPMVLRQTDTVRLVFKPTLVNNQNDTDASVSGVLCYQRKRRDDDWEDVEAISLSSLRAGEGVKLELHSAEVLKMFRGLNVMYETVERDGVPTGEYTYLRADRGTVLADVADLLRAGGVNDVLRAFITWAQGAQADLVQEMAQVDPSTLDVFDAAVGAARLQAFLDTAEANLGNNDEGFWQELLGKHSWAISQLYAAPMVIVRGQAYVGGKSIANQGGNVVDYMFANALSQNSLLVELKTPVTPLTTANTYRNNVYPPHAELAGATQQLLQARQSLQENYLTLAAADPGKFNVFGTKALLIVGTLPPDEDRLRSFETYRNAHRGLDIVTFDELIEKGKLLLQALIG